MEFRKARKSESRLRIAISGASGSGKTFSALRIANGIGGRIAVIDTERSSASLYADLVDFDTLNIEPPFEPQKYVEAIKAAEKAGYEVIIIDSLSHAWSGTGGLLDLHDSIQKSNRGVSGFSAWKEITPIQNRFVDAILSSKCHVIATLRAKQDYVVEKGEYKTQVRKVGLAPIQRDGLEYEFTIFFELSQEHIATASKDRTNLFDGKYFTPAENTGKLLVNWLRSAENEEANAGTSENTGASKEEPKKNIITGDFNNTPYGRRTIADNDQRCVDAVDGVGGEAENRDGKGVADAQKKTKTGIQDIARMIGPELKAAFGRLSFTTRQIVELWERHEGDQDRILEEIAGKMAA